MNKSFIRAVLYHIPILKKLIVKYENLKERVNYLSEQLSQSEAEKLSLSQQLSQSEAEKLSLSQQLSQQHDNIVASRHYLVDAFVRYLCQREPREEEIAEYSNSNMSEREIFIHFYTSEEYQKRLHIPQNNKLVGILAKAESINANLLYPGFDQAQLFVTLTDEPYQLSDFHACLSFLKEKNWITLEKATFLDIGANIGSMSIYAIASGYYTQAIAIEPSALNHQFMLWNIAINNLQDKIHSLNYGVANFVGKKDLICSPYNCGDFRISSQLSENSQNLYHEDQFNVEKVNFSTLDDLSNKYNIVAGNIGWVCIDCQGSEGLIFKGGKEFFKRLNAPIYVEFWPYGINRLNCRNDYFEFITEYAESVFRWVQKEIQLIDIDFLKNFYEQNVNTTLHLDILLLPPKM